MRANQMRIKPSKDEKSFKYNDERKKFNSELSELIKVTRNIRDGVYIVACILAAIFIMLVSYTLAI